jgi:hypothetical protein
MSRSPPVPPASRPTKGPKSDRAQPPRAGKLDAEGRKPAPDNLEDQGEQGNIHQNTHNQQDR